MFNAELVTQLSRFMPSDDSERMSLEVLRQFVAENALAFERSLLFGHVTASALLLNKDTTKFLLMHHRKLDKWVQLGGHCDGNPDTLAVALKEASEESGIDRIEAVSPEIADVDVHLIPLGKGVPAHFHFDVRYIVKTVATDDLVINHESCALQWFSFSDALPSIEPSVQRLITKARHLISV